MGESRWQASSGADTLEDRSARIWGGNERTRFFFYHKTVVAVNALSARVTEGVPINNTLQNKTFSGAAN